MYDTVRMHVTMEVACNHNNIKMQVKPAYAIAIDPKWNPAAHSAANRYSVYHAGVRNGVIKNLI